MSAIVCMSDSEEFPEISLITSFLIAPSAPVIIIGFVVVFKCHVRAISITKYFYDLPQLICFTRVMNIIAQLFACNLEAKQPSLRRLSCRPRNLTGIAYPQLWKSLWVCQPEQRPLLLHGTFFFNLLCHFLQQCYYPNDKIPNVYQGPLMTALWSFSKRFSLKMVVSRIRFIGY